MKKSEMIGIMKLLCCRESIRPANISTEEFCNEMLELIESEGMLPPTVNNDPRQESYFDINEWEEE